MRWPLKNTGPRPIPKPKPVTCLMWVTSDQHGNIRRHADGKPLLHHYKPTGGMGATLYYGEFTVWKPRRVKVTVDPQ